MTATPPERVSLRYPCFDGMRALAAIAVLLHHASIMTAYSLRGFDVPLAGDGRFGEYFAHMDAGVQVFFLISGFLLYRPFVMAALAGQHLTVTTFFRHRFLRIFPAYWLAFIGITLFIGLRMPVGGARSITEYFFLVHLYDPTSAVDESGRHVWRALGGISQSWTLVVELSFYLFLPVYAAIMQRVAGHRERMARLKIEGIGLLVLVLVSIAWRAIAFWGVADGSALEFLMPYWLPAQLDLFAMGMGLAVLRAWADTRDTTTVSWCDRVASIDWIWWVLAAVTFHAVTFWIGLTGRLELVSGGTAYMRQLLYGLTAFFLLVPIAFGRQDRGPIRWVLRTAPVVYLGVISYGIYLWHQAFLTKVHQWGGWDDFRGSFLAHVAGAFALTIVVASLSWFFVEKPILKSKDKPLFRRRARTTATT